MDIIGRAVAKLAHFQRGPSVVILRLLHWLNLMSHLKISSIFQIIDFFKNEERNSEVHYFDTCYYFEIYKNFMFK